jgi:hypothetical protein
MKEQSEKYPRLIRIFVDGGFSGQEFMRLACIIHEHLFKSRESLTPKRA